MVIDKVEDKFQEMWKDIILNDDGSVNLEQVKKELYDFSCVMREVSKAYCEVTCGKISKPNTDARHIIDCVEERIQDNISDALADN